jgi:hypothetical protein
LPGAMCNDRIKPPQILFLLFLIFSVFIFFSPSQKFSFISDDYHYISLNSIANILTFKSGFYHYNPVFWFIVWLTKLLIGQRPFYFHLLALTFHILNITAVYLLGRKILKSYQAAYFSAFAFAFFFGCYEVVYWISGLNTSIMVLFYILGLILFISYTDNRKLSSYILFLIFYILAVLSHEYAVSLPVVCLIYWILFSNKKIKPVKCIKLFAFPLLIPVFLTVLKLLYSHAPLAAQSVTVPRFVASVIKSSLYLFFPDPYLIDKLPQVVLIFLFIILFIFLLLNIFKNRLNFFLFMWTAISVILFSATSLPKSPYFYLSFIPAIYLITSVQKFKLLNWKIIYPVFIIISGLVFLYQQENLWRVSSNINQNVLRDIKSLMLSPNPSQNIYFVNLPDSVNGPPWHAYIFRNGLDNALQIMYGKSFHDIKYFRTSPSYATAREDPYIDQNGLEKFKQDGAVVFIYSLKEQTVKLL